MFLLQSTDRKCHVVYQMCHFPMTQMILKVNCLLQAFSNLTYKPHNVTFGRMLLRYKAQPASVRLHVLQVGGHSLLSNG